MTAGEDQAESLVRDLLHLVHLQRGHRGQRVRLLATDVLATETIDRPVLRRGHDPRARVRGNAVARPPFEGDLERFLYGVLGQVEAAGHADQRGDRASRLPPERAVDDGEGGRRYRGAPSNSITGRPSTDPSHAPGHLAAASSASSRFAASIK